jgi:hypothetical protein
MTGSYLQATRQWSRSRSNYFCSLGLVCGGQRIALLHDAVKTPGRPWIRTEAAPEESKVKNVAGRYWTVTVMVTGVGLVTVADPAGVTAPVGVAVMM